MPKINLVTVNTPLNSSSFQQEINSNFTAIEEALEKQLQREPQEGVNNAMQQELDMNSYRIINLGAPINPSDAARKQDVDDALKPNLEANKVLISDNEGNISNSSITNTELETLGGISGNIQAQLNSKQAVIPDLDAIRAGATAGASALQADNLKTINGESLVGEGNIEIQATLANLTDVSLSSPENGQVLSFNTSSQKWENVKLSETYKGVYDSTKTYLRGDIVFDGSNEMYIAWKDVPVNTGPSQYNYWKSISDDKRVGYEEKSDNVEYPVGFTNSGISGLNYAGSMNFTTKSSPTINASTGALTAAVLKTTTQSQGDNSTNVATTEYVDTAVAGAGSQPVYNSSTNTLEF